MTKHLAIASTLFATLLLAPIAHADTQADAKKASELNAIEKKHELIKKADAFQKEEDKRINDQKTADAEEKERKRQEDNKKQPLKVLELAAKYESNNRGPGAVLGELDDGAGMNYGTYSLTQNHTMKPYLKFLEEKYPDLRSQLPDDIGSNTFNEAWKTLGDKDGERFKQTQAEFIFNKDILPAIDKLKKDTGVDLLDGTHTLGTVGMFASMIHNAGYGWYGTIKTAAQTLATTHDDNAFIEATGGHIRDNYSGRYATGIRNRYRKQTPDEQARTELFWYIRP